MPPCDYLLISISKILNNINKAIDSKITIHYTIFNQFDKTIEQIDLKGVKKVIKSNLRVLLAKKKMNISDVSRGTGISRTTLSSLYHESGKGINFDTLGRLCLYLNCEVGELLLIEIEEVA